MRQIDFECLTVHMGKNLRLLLRMEPDDVRAKYFGDLFEAAEPGDEAHSEGSAHHN